MGVDHYCLSPSTCGTAGFYCSNAVEAQDVQRRRLTTLDAAASAGGCRKHGRYDASCTDCFKIASAGADPEPHGWVHPVNRSVDDWECRCGAFGSHLWMGFAYHLLDRLAEVQARGGPSVDVETLTTAIQNVAKMNPPHPALPVSRTIPEAAAAYAAEYARLSVGEPRPETKE